MATTRRAFLRHSLCFGAAATLSIKEISALSSSVLESKSLPTGIPSVGSPAGRDLSKKPFPELKASGSPGSMGLAHGKTFAAKVRHNVGFYLDYLSKRTHSEKKDVLARAHGFMGVLSKHFPLLLEEMRGIAKGANCHIDEILAVNARTDLLVLCQKTRKRDQGREQDRDTPGCTALALIEEKKHREQIALGQNWDWNRALRANSVILRLKPLKGRRIVTFTEAGMVGKIGFNDRRLGVCLNFLSHHTDAPDADPGVPVHVLLRAVMSCDDIEKALELISSVPRCASANFLMAQNSKDGVSALDVEWTSRAIARLMPEDRILVHTNHFKDKELGGRIKSGNSFQRDTRAKIAATELRKKEGDPAIRMKLILSLHDSDPVALSRESTQAGIVMDLSRNKLHLCSGPPHKGKWIERPGV